MAAGSAEAEGRNGGGSGNPERPIKHSQAAYGSARAPAAALSHARDAEDDAHALVAAYEDALAYAHGLAYVSLSVKASGLLALLLSTVILLGGYVQSLEKKDFFCITVITVIQAAGIFKDYYKSVVYFLDFGFTAFFLLGSVFSPDGCLGPLFVVLLPVLYPVAIGMLCAELIYMFGPFACAAISSWRIAKLNHGNMDGTDSMVDMMAALNVFYSLIILQGAMFWVLLVTIGVGRRRVSASHLNKLELLSEEWWGKIAIHTYLYDISAKCRKDPLSTKGMDLIKHGVELLDSESQDDYLYGARILSAFINKGGDVRRLLLHSTDRIQRLIDSLWIGTGSLDESSAEIRELAATIVADLAGHIDVGRYPGAMRCISSLLQHQEETTRTYRCISDPNPQRRRPMGPLTKGKQGEDDPEKMAHRFRLMRDNMDLRRPRIAEKRQRRQKREGGTSNGNVVILRGLTILERLASNNDGNRRLICGAPDLLAKITAPVYSANLIEDVKTNKACADIVTRCLKVLYQLIRAPDGSHEIFSNNDKALSNLESILLKLGNNDEAGHQELQLVVMKILTELSLVLDPSANRTEEIKKVLIKEQLKVFLLANGHAAATAGRTLVSLSTNSKSNSALIITTQNGTNIGSVTGILDDKNNNITRRTIAAEIMANLCAHCTVDVNNMKEILPKVLREIMSIKIKSQERQISAGQNNPASGDEENQGNSVSTNNEERHIIPWVHRLVRSLRRCLGLRVQQEGLTRIEENSNQEREEQADQEREEQAEAFLSLAQVIFDKLKSADLDSAIQSAVDQNNTRNEEQRREAFVDKLKTIIDDNCHPTADNLRIVKLCGQIAESTMGCQQYAKHFKNKDFKASLSKASKTMSELESCMFFVGTDFGLKKTVRPLFSKIEETWSEM